MQGARASAQVGVTKQALGRSSSHPRTLAQEEWGGEQDPALARGFLWELKESWAGALNPLESHLLLDCAFCSVVYSQHAGFLGVPFRRGPPDPFPLPRLLVCAFMLRRHQGSSDFFVSSSSNPSGAEV